jgi:hypothetical protein
MPLCYSFLNTFRRETLLRNTRIPYEMLPIHAQDLLEERPFIQYFIKGKKGD